MHCIRQLTFPLAVLAATLLAPSVTADSSITLSGDTYRGPQFGTKLENLVTMFNGIPRIAAVAGHIIMKNANKNGMLLSPDIESTNKLIQKYNTDYATFLENESSVEVGELFKTFLTMLPTDLLYVKENDCYSELYRNRDKINKLVDDYRTETDPEKKIFDRKNLLSKASIVLYNQSEQPHYVRFLEFVLLVYGSVFKANERNSGIRSRLIQELSPTIFRPKGRNCISTIAYDIEGVKRLYLETYSTLALERYRQFSSDKVPPLPAPYSHSHAQTPKSRKDPMETDQTIEYPIHSPPGHSGGGSSSGKPQPDKTVPKQKKSPKNKEKGALGALDPSDLDAFLVSSYL